MSKYCPYKDENVVYLECQECEQRICQDDTFFCLVVGSRTFTDYSLLNQKLDYFLRNQRNLVIVSGGANGADSLAARYAREHNYPVIIFDAEWDKFGKSAGYIRNETMHKFVAKQKHRGCVMFWDGKSTGTKHSLTLSHKYNNPLRIVYV